MEIVYKIIAIIEAVFLRVYDQVLMPMVGYNPQLLINIALLLIALKLMHVVYKMFFGKKRLHIKKRRSRNSSSSGKIYKVDPNSKDAELIPRIQEFSQQLYQIVKDSKELHMLKLTMEITKSNDVEKISALLHPDIRRSNERFLVAELMSSLIMAANAQNLGAVAAQLQALKLDVNNIKTLLNDINRVIGPLKGVEKMATKETSITQALTNARLMVESALPRHATAQGHLAEQSPRPFMAMLERLTNSIMNPQHHMPHGHHQTQQINPINRFLQDSLSLMMNAGLRIMEPFRPQQDVNHHRVDRHREHHDHHRGIRHHDTHHNQRSGHLDDRLPNSRHLRDTHSHGKEHRQAIKVLDLRSADQLVGDIIMLAQLASASKSHHHSHAARQNREVLGTNNIEQLIKASERLSEITKDPLQQQITSMLRHAVSKEKPHQSNLAAERNEAPSHHR